MPPMIWKEKKYGIRYLVITLLLVGYMCMNMCMCMCMSCVTCKEKK